MEEEGKEERAEERCGEEREGEEEEESMEDEKGREGEARTGEEVAVVDVASFRGDDRFTPVACGLSGRVEATEATSSPSTLSASESEDIVRQSKYERERCVTSGMWSGVESVTRC